MSSLGQLEEWAAKNIPHFVGVFMSDELEQVPLRPNAPLQSMIFNYDPSTKPGSHWVGVRVVRGSDGKRTAEWFDSYGTRPDGDDQVLHDTTHFMRWLKSKAATVKRSLYDLQALETTVCGHYSLWFCKNGEPLISTPAWRPFFEITPVPTFGAVNTKLLHQTPAQKDAARKRDSLIAKLVRL